MQATRTLTLDDVALDGGRWVLTVVHHPDPARLGGRVVIPCGEALTLGRDAAASGGLLDDPSVSRRHARVEADDAALRVTDLGSSNGTWRGDARGAGFPAFSEAMARVAAALADVPAGARVVLLHGPPLRGRRRRWSVGPVGYRARRSTPSVSNSPSSIATSSQG